MSLKTSLLLPTNSNANTVSTSDNQQQQHQEDIQDNSNISQIFVVPNAISTTASTGNALSYHQIPSWKDNSYSEEYSVGNMNDSALSIASVGSRVYDQQQQQSQRQLGGYNSIAEFTLFTPTPSTTVESQNANANSTVVSGTATSTSPIPLYFNNRIGNINRSSSTSPYQLRAHDASSILSSSHNRRHSQLFEESTSQLDITAQNQHSYYIDDDENDEDGIDIRTNNNNNINQSIKQRFICCACRCCSMIYKRCTKHWYSLRAPSSEESLDFEIMDNSLSSQIEYKNNQLDTKAIAQINHHIEIQRWIISFIIGLTMALVGVGVSYSIAQLLDIQYEYIRRKVLDDPNSSSNINHIMLTYAGWNACYVVIAASLICFLDKRAEGSGIPEIKAYLNGRKIHRVISLRTATSKIIGCILACAACLFVGKEGPLIHIGSAIGAIIGQGRTETKGFQLFNLAACFKKSSEKEEVWFLRDSEKRQFVAIGAACGVAAGFGSTLGSVLFIIEEGARSFKVGLLWRALFATLVCSTFVDLFLTQVYKYSEFGNMSQSSIISFGSFEGASRHKLYYPVQHSWNIKQVPLFIGIGIIGGTLGAIFIRGYSVLKKLRIRLKMSPVMRIIEAASIAFLTSIVVYTVSRYEKCRSLEKAEFSTSFNYTLCPLREAKSGPETLYKACSDIMPTGLFCEENNKHESWYYSMNADSKYFSDLESLLLASDMAGAVRQMYHSPLLYSYKSLLSYFGVVFFFALISFGIAVPSGLFIPLIALGACFGRIIGQLMFENISVDYFGNIDPGTYALLGSAAMLAGITRVTISLVIILVEATGNQTYSIPLVISSLTAKLIGDLMSRGVYEEQIHIAKILFIEEDPPTVLEGKVAGTIMTPNPVTFRICEKVSTILRVLKSTNHNGFPIVSSSELSSDATIAEGEDSSTINSSGIQHIPQQDENIASTYENKVQDGLFLGLVLRSQLYILLWELQFMDETELGEPQYSTIDWKSFYNHYPRVPKLRDILRRLSTIDIEHKYIDLRPIMNRGALSVNTDTSAIKIHEMFQSIGIRHLTVTDRYNRVVGIITRKEIVDVNE